MTINWPEWNRVINEHFVPLTKNKDRYLILYGSRGSSKSDFAAKVLVFRALAHRYFKCILYRKNYNSIKDSSYETIKQTIYDLGLESLFSFKQNPLEITCIVNNNKFIARGGDDPNKLKSIKDPSCVWYEEDVPNEEDFATITLTIRGGKADLLQEIFTINPQVEGDYQDNWFWKRFFAGNIETSFRNATNVEVEGKEVTYYYTVHHSTYQHNRWLTDDVKAQIEDYKTKNPYLYSVYAKGLWTAKETGGNFYKNFNRAMHTGKVDYNPDIPIHLSFDFNVNPYCTGQVWQIVGKDAYCIDEIPARYPHNSTKGVCKLFMQKYFAHKAGLFIYGDPAGKSEDTRSEKGSNDYRIIAQELAQFKPSFRLHSKAPAVAMRGNWINQILGFNEGGIKIMISDKCTHTINDFSYLKEASDGTKHKEKVKDPETGVQYEKWGHCFVEETMIKTITGHKRIDELTTNDYVLTRQGYKKVKNVFFNGHRYTKKYRIGDTLIECTPEHNFWTKEKGFYPIGHLTVSNTFCIFDKNSNTWKEKQLLIEELTFTDTQMQKAERKGFIFQVEKVLKKLDCTSINTCKKLEKYQKEAIYIIKMAIRLTMKLIILNVLQQGSILASTCKMRKDKINQGKFLINMQDQRLSSGISRKREKNGIQFTLKIKLQIIKSTLNVLNVVMILLGTKRDHLQKQNIAHLNASQDIGRELIENQENGTKKETALSAKANLKYIDGIKQSVVLENAPLSLKKVYDIEVEDCHEYFANGILVHNCSDACDYFLTYCFGSEYENFQRGGSNKIPTFGKRIIKHSY